MAFTQLNSNSFENINNKKCGIDLKLGIISLLL